ncbi:hypothetical protein ABKV19_002749 [Rosa sericea]
MASPPFTLISIYRSYESESKMGERQNKPQKWKRIISKSIQSSQIYETVLFENEIETVRSHKLGSKGQRRRKWDTGGLQQVTFKLQFAESTLFVEVHDERIDVAYSPRSGMRPSKDTEMQKQIDKKLGYLHS